MHAWINKHTYAVWMGSGEHVHIYSVTLFLWMKCVFVCATPPRREVSALIVLICGRADLKKKKHQWPIVVVLFWIVLLPACFRKIVLFPLQVSVVNRWFDISQMTTKVKLWLPGNCKTDACPYRATKREHARRELLLYTFTQDQKMEIFWRTMALEVAELIGGMFLDLQRAQSIKCK